MIDLLRGLVQFYIPNTPERRAYNNVSVQRLGAVRTRNTGQLLMNSAWLFDFQGLSDTNSGDRLKLPAFYAQIWERL